MAEVTSSQVKELRERTGAGMMDCKKALTECNADMDKAIDFLREKGLAAAAKKEGRIAAEGTVEAYIHGGGRIGVLLELNCETDFVSRGDEFKQLTKDIAMQIAAAKPLYVNKEDVPADVVAHEKEIFRAQALNEGKPEKIVDKMVDGRIEKFYKEVCLVEQPFIKDPDVLVKDLIMAKIAKIGEKIAIRRFTRYELGEGIEKRQDNFADEVMKEINR
ncbi:MULTISPECIES: translation elongation factor Ts [Dehalobacter]|jgi:elongation factor Ts|uniref:Elongation factor Ts n=2 Tax=Dehalobacter restrictus TaxID=55583 RepID=A0A857DHD2_9FIRM|nr:MULTISPECIES: translation elongation factor Ts [Dehalobacter]AHF09610.1 elongation factor Ts [Dehalobacter restrictus DSM 9455]MCG1026563.1 translation elongation factor Ts [Dehalobacter sp.]MDJ0304352.1 translation elongation factor Ts [Dehalobacter sp.]OCZ54949.1 elongation factor Ts [Dehalobacter sp. TeCB1]QHA00203.1 translation elongation factor Ts [Dehalobacter restrictus]